MIRIEMKTTGAAIADDPAGEPARIIRELAEKWTDASAVRSQKLFDYNGNHIGDVTVQ